RINHGRLATRGFRGSFGLGIFRFKGCQDRAKIPIIRACRPFPISKSISRTFYEGVVFVSTRNHRVAENKISVAAVTDDLDNRNAIASGKSPYAAEIIYIDRSDPGHVTIHNKLVGRRGGI